MWRDFSSDHPLNSEILNQVKITDLPSVSASVHKNYTSECNLQHELLVSWQDTIQEEDSEESGELERISEDNEYEELERVSLEYKTADSSNKKVRKVKLAR